MAACPVLLFVAMAVTAAPFVTGTDLSASGYNVCSRKESYQQPYTVTVLASGWQVYYTRCRWIFQCARYRRVYYTQYRTMQRTAYRAVYHCCPGWQQSGNSCQTPICSNTCRNGGACTAPDVCTCAGGFTGSRCQTDIDDCSSNPCQNGATCHDGLNSYTCECATGWLGLHCDNDTNDCSLNPCKNDATCHDGLNSYTCACVAGWEGSHCENETDECSSNPCQNGATCHDGLNSYTCECTAGWEGRHCENGRVMEPSPSALTTKPGVTSDNDGTSDAIQNTARTSSTHPLEPELTVLARLNVSLTLTAPRSVTLSSLRNSIKESLKPHAGDFCEAKCEIGEIFLLDVTETDGARRKRQAADGEVHINVIIQLIVSANQKLSYTSNATVAAENLLQEKAEALRKLARSGILSVSIDGEEFGLMDNSDNSESCPPGQDYNTDGSCEKERNTAPWLIGVICAAALVIISIAVVAVLIYRRKHKPSANLHGKSGNEMTNLETPGRRHDHTGSDGSVDNVIYNTDDEGFVDNIIYNAVDAGTVDNVIYNAVDAGTVDNVIYNAVDAGTVDNTIYNAVDEGTEDNAMYNADDAGTVNNAI